MKNYLLYFIFIISYSLISYNQNYAQNNKKEAPIVYKAKGDHYRRLGLLDKALNEYDKAVSLKKDFPEAYYWSAYIYSQKGLFIQALFEIELAQKYKNNFALITKYYNLLFLEVDIYLKMKENEKANTLIDNITLLLKENIKDTGSHNTKLRKYFYYKLGQTYFYKAKYMFKENMKENMKEKNKENIERKLNYFDKAIAYNYKKDLAYYNKYLLYSNINKTKAKLSLENALKINPNIILDAKRMDK